MFLASTTPFVTAVQQIADSCGASADTEMTTRSWRSLNAAIQHFNNRFKWNWLFTETAPTLITYPFSVTGVTASGGQASATCPAGHTLAVDDLLTGSLFGLGTRVSATAASGFGVNLAVLGTGSSTINVTSTRDYYSIPTDLKAVYSVRLLSADRALKPVSQRAWDRASTTETVEGTTQWYTTFNFGTKSKIRLMPPPDAADYMVIRYHRGMATASASASTATLDIAADYEPYLMAWAKWHFLTDKGEERKAQSTTWLSLAEDGLRTMLKDQTNQPDDELRFTPGHAQGGYTSDTSTRGIAWDH